MLDWIRLPPATLPDEALLRVADSALEPIDWDTLGSRPPSAAPVALALHPDDAWLVAIHVPPLTGERRQQAIASQLEALFPDPLDQYFWRAQPTDSQSTLVSVVRRSALTFWQDRCQRAGLRRVAGLWPAAASLPPEPSLHLHRWPAGWFWRSQQAPNAILRWTDALPAGLLATPTVDSWSADAGGTPPPSGLDATAKAPILTKIAADTALAFPSRSETSNAASSFSVSAGLALLLLAIWITGWQWQISQLRQNVQALQSSIETQFREAFPEIPVILDPIAQAQRALETDLGSEAAESPLDQLMNLAALAPSLSGRVTALEFTQDGATLSLDDESASQELAALSEALGWRVTQDPQQQTLWRLQWSATTP